MRKGGRKPNLDMIQVVKEYRDKSLTYREIQMLLEKRHKKNFTLAQLHFWANYNVSENVLVSGRDSGLSTASSGRA